MSGTHLTSSCGKLKSMFSVAWPALDGTYMMKHSKIQCSLENKHKITLMLVNILITLMFVNILITSYCVIFHRCGPGSGLHLHRRDRSPQGCVQAVHFWDREHPRRTSSSAEWPRTQRRPGMTQLLHRIISQPNILLLTQLLWRIISEPAILFLTQLMYRIIAEPAILFLTQLLYRII